MNSTTPSTTAKRPSRAQRNAERNAAKHPATVKQEAANEALLAAQTTPAPAQAEPAPQQEKPKVASRWTTWKGISNAQRFVFLGQRSAEPGQPFLVVKVTTERSGQQITFTDDSGQIVGQFGTATKFWAAPVPGEDAKPTEDTKAVRRAAGKTSPAEGSASKLHPCKCGCGSMIKNLYAQGHDARHVSQLAESYRQAVKGDTSESELAKLLTGIMAEVKFSDRLTAKLARSVELIDEKAAKSAAAKASAKAA